MLRLFAKFLKFYCNHVSCVKCRLRRIVGCDCLMNKIQCPLYWDVEPRYIREHSISFTPCRVNDSINATANID